MQFHDRNDMLSLTSEAPLETQKVYRDNSLGPEITLKNGSDRVKGQYHPAVSATNTDFGSRSFTDWEVASKLIHSASRGLQVPLGESNMSRVPNLSERKFSIDWGDDQNGDKTTSHCQFRWHPDSSNSPGPKELLDWISCSINNISRQFSIPISSFLRALPDHLQANGSTHCCSATVQSLINDLWLFANPQDTSKSAPMLKVTDKCQMPEVAPAIKVEDKTTRTSSPEALQLSINSSEIEVEAYRQRALRSPCSHKDSSASHFNSKAGPWGCWNCNASKFGNVTAWKRHMEQRDPEKIFVCPICSTIKHRKDFMRDHLINHHQETVQNAQQVVTRCTVWNEPHKERECGYCGESFSTWREFYVEHMQDHFNGRIPYKSLNWKSPFYDRTKSTSSTYFAAGSTSASYDDGNQSDGNLSSETSHSSFDYGDRANLAHSQSPHDIQLYVSEQPRSDSDCWRRSFGQMRIASFKSEQPHFQKSNPNHLENEEGANGICERSSSLDVAHPSTSVLTQETKVPLMVQKAPVLGSRLLETTAATSCPFFGQEPYYREVFMHGEVFYHSEKKIWSSKKSVIDLVREQTTNKLYARKTLRATGQASLTQKQYKRELDIMRKLTELGAPHTTRLITYSTQANNCSLVMYPVADCSLRQYLEKPGELHQANLSKWVGCLAAAIKFLHSPRINIRHGDVKPANILIRGSNVYLADFGESRMIPPGDEQSPNRDRFTVMYSAPEVLENRVCGKPTDIWSLGCVFAEIFTVICGRSYQNYHKMLNTCSKVCQSHPAHQVRLQAILAWIRDFTSVCNDKHSDREESSQQRLAMAIDTITRMLVPSPGDRVSAEQVYDAFPHSPICNSRYLIPFARGKAQVERTKSLQSQGHFNDNLEYGNQAQYSVPTIVEPGQQQKTEVHRASTALKLDLSDARRSYLGSPTKDSISDPLNQGKTSDESSDQAAERCVIRDNAANHLQVPGQETPVNPRGFKRGRSASINSAKSSPKSSDATENCHVRLGFRDSEQQERSSQRPSKRIILQVSRKTRDSLLKVLKDPSVSSLYFLPLDITPNMP